MAAAARYGFAAASAVRCSMRVPCPRVGGIRTRDAPVVVTPVRPVAVEHVGLQPLVRVDVRGQDRRHAFVVRQQPRDASARQLRQALRVVRVVESVRAVLAPEREVHVQSAAAAIAERPAEERRQLPVVFADLADQELEQERLVGRRDRVRVLDVHFIGRVVVLAAPALDREPALDGGVDELVDRRPSGRPTCRCRRRGATARPRAPPSPRSAPEGRTRVRTRPAAPTPSVATARRPDAGRAVSPTGRAPRASSRSAIPTIVFSSQPSWSESRSSVASMSCNPTSNCVRGTDRISLSCVSG